MDSLLRVRRKVRLSGEALGSVGDGLRVPVRAVWALPAGALVVAIVGAIVLLSGGPGAHEVRSYEAPRGPSLDMAPMVANAAVEEDGGASAGGGERGGDSAGEDFDPTLVPPALLPIAREAVGLRSKDSRHIFLSTYAGNEKIMRNWGAALKRHGIEEMLVVAMNSLGYRELQQWGIPCIMFNGTGESEEAVKERFQRYDEGLKTQNPRRSYRHYMVRRKMFWHTRTMILNAVLQTGTTVTLADIDAIAKGDPRQVFEPLLAEFDVIGSRVYWPFNTNTPMGASICMGFVTIKSTDKMRRFMRERVMPLVDAEGDDQGGFNRALDGDGILKEPKERSGTQERKPLVMRTAGLGLKIYIATQYTYVRSCTELDINETKAATVLHCPKHVRSSEASAKLFEYWFLPDE